MKFEDGKQYMFPGCCILNPLTHELTGMLKIMTATVLAEHYGGAQAIELFPPPICVGRFKNCTAPPKLSEAIEYDPTMSSMFLTTKEGTFKTGIMEAKLVNQFLKIHKDSLSEMETMYQKDLVSFVAPRKSLAFNVIDCYITESELQWSPEIIPPIVDKRKKIYLTGKFSKRFKFRHDRWFLQSKGYDFTSSWIDQEASAADYPSARKEIAERDIADVRACDVMIVDSESSTHGGMHYEMGYAKALGKRVVLVGTSDMLFSTLADVQFPSGWAEFYAFIRDGGKL